MDDDIIDKNLVSKKHRKLISQLRDIEDSDADTFNNKDIDSTSDNDDIPAPVITDSSFLPSTMLKNKKKKKDNDEYDPDKWFADMMEINDVGKINKSGKNDYYSTLDNGDFIFGKKKKKKHKKKDGDDEKIDFKKEFEPEMALYRNLLIEQNKFTDNLQKQYDNITGFKSSSRGITKQLSDLIENITDARSLSMQLVEKNVNAKKLIAELSLKQRKELGEVNTDNLTDAASSYIKQLMSERQSILSGANGDNTISEYSDDEMINMIDESIGNNTDRTDETEKYLKYENSNVTIYVVIEDDDIENYHFVAKDGDDNVLDDYPLPLHTDISVNRSTNIATDSYGEKYPIIFK